MTSSIPFLVLMRICCISFLKSVFGTNKFIRILNQMSMKFHSKLGPLHGDLSKDLDKDVSEAPNLLSSKGL